MRDSIDWRLAVIAIVGGLVLLTMILVFLPVGPEHWLVK